MIAALTSLGMFTFCTVVGLGIVAALNTQKKPYLPLLAPILGAAALIIPAVWLSEAGVPIARGGPILLTVAFAAAILSIVRWPARLDLRSYWPFAAIALGGFFLSAWPMFQFGFNWMSYSNDDMANYVLNAERLLELGWFTVPDYTVYNFNKDPTAIYWMNWTVNNERFGAEMAVTLAMSVTRLNGFQLFMSVMNVLGLTQILAAGALIYRSERYRSAAILTSALMAVSALGTFGTEYQLLAQAFGLPLLIAGITLLCDVPSKLSVRPLIACSIAIAGLAVVYPELTPFLFTSAALYFGLRFYRRTLAPGIAAAWFGSVGVLTTAIVNAYMRNYLTVMESRVSQSAAGENGKFFIITFPFYLIPAGIPSLFGLISAVQNIPEPWSSLLILLGFVLLALTFAAALRATRAGEAAGPVVLVMLALGVLLFWKQNGFSLFKIAMYLQPFMIGCLVLWWSDLKHRAWKPAIAVLPVAVFAILNLLTQQFFVDRTRAAWSKEGTTFIEIPNASASHLLDEFQELVPIANKPGMTFVADSANVVFAKIESFYARPANVIFPSDNYLPGTFIVPADPLIQRLLIPSLVGKALEMSAERGRTFRRPDYLFIDDYGRLAYNGFFANTQVPALEQHPRNVMLVTDSAAQSVLNRRYNSDTKNNFEVVPLGSVRNHLIFVAARYGLAYYSHSKTSSLFQLEPDLFYENRTMAGMGRRFLFNIIHPAKKIRLEVTYTTTLKDDGECILYNPWITGATLQRQYAHVIGRGSARVFLPAVAPRIMVGQPYVMLDMGVNGTVFPSNRTGLMLLYGRDIPLDGRRLVGFVRDISVVSDEDYRSMRPPSYLSDPHKDLLDRDLEYSGAYEDGWISESSQYGLTHAPNLSVLAVRGVVPLTLDPNYHSVLRILVADREIGRADVGVGTFDLGFPVPANIPSRAIVKLLFSGFQRLPGGDDRPVAMKMYSLGFQTAKQASQSQRIGMLRTRQRLNWYEAIAKARIDFGSGWYPLESYAGATFRWANNDAVIVVRARTTGNSSLAVDVAPGPGEGANPAVLHLRDAAGRDLAAVTIAQRQIVKFPLKASKSPETYTLHIDGGGTKVPSDPRILDFRVFAISVK